MQIVICDYCKKDLTKEGNYYQFTVNYHIIRKFQSQKNNHFVTKSRDVCKDCFGKIMTNAQIQFEE